MYDTTNMAHNNSNAQSYTHREMLREKKEFLSYEVQLAAFGGKAASGSHNFPFSVMLPPGLPPSMKVSVLHGRARRAFSFFFSHGSEATVAPFFYSKVCNWLLASSSLRGHLCCS